MRTNGVARTTPAPAGATGRGPTATDEHPPLPTSPSRPPPAPQAEPVPTTPEQFGELMRREYARYEAVVKASGAKAD